MAQGVITKKGREKLCKAHTGDATLPRITKMVFGNGGIGGGGQVIEPTGEETQLKGFLLEKTIESHSYPVTTTARYTAKLEKTELANENISEQGLVDEEGDLVAYKTFLPKGKDDDMEFIFDMDEIF
ncbi:MAG: phage tail protein [Clostridiales bacterium]|nr:phage tail protein [Clostridiales bacterium]HIS61454.1 phage tail protein [Candidatus Scybalomonas excrementigallinarum]